MRSGFAAVGVYAEREHGIAGLGPACWALFESGVRGSTFDRALTGLGHAPDPALVTELIGVYRAHPPRIKLLPDAHACLERWLGRAYIGIVTDGPAASQRAKIAALELSTYVDRAVVTSELAADAGKPDPRAFALLQGESAAPASSAATWPTTRPRTSAVPVRWAGARCACGAPAACMPRRPAAPTSTARSPP